MARVHNTIVTRHIFFRLNGQEEIFKRVRWIMDSGLNLHWHEDLIPDPGPCWTKFHPDHLHDYASLNYQDFAVIFYLLLCSHGLAFCGYLSELVLFHWCCLKSRSRIGPNSYLN
ncbi:hypothetical protein HPB47_026215 [Ixodes persulcatus]|uniref:Uncharacterized protein n=1 Tax=Ixodes persulcatus TaxID=34615 RepID=A0AC60PZK0_IXOPE|nr:hypothetical protein HPB47_026215 [Ixodes persulcatus]